MTHIWKCFKCFTGGLVSNGEVRFTGHVFYAKQNSSLLGTLTFSLFSKSKIHKNNPLSPFF